MLWSIRLPRLVLALAAGAALGSSGAAVQGIFRNPLAAPRLIGMSTGAALFVALGIVAFSRWHVPTVAEHISLPILAFAGCAGMTTIVMFVARVGGGMTTSTLLLAGVALDAVAGAAIGLLVFVADDAALRDIQYWLLGSVGGATWPALWVTLPLFTIALLGLVRLGPALDAMTLGEHVAGHLGVDVERTKLAAIALCALGVGASVALCGAIGFVGLVVPHLWRLVVGPHHRSLIIGSAALGALLLVAADLGARTLVSPAELPVGILTALVGAPFFMWLLFRSRGGYAHQGLGR